MQLTIIDNSPNLNLKVNRIDIVGPRQERVYSTDIGSETIGSVGDG